MRRLVAIDLPGGQGFVKALQRIWDDGDAALPLDARLPAPARRALVDTMDAEAVVDTGGETATGAGRPVDDGDALVVATSGSTGEPKGVVLTHDAVAASARITSAALGVDPGRDRWLACLPPAHIGGLSVVTRALHTGTALEVHAGFDADAVADAAARRGANLVSLVVTALGRVDATAFRTILLGGSAIPADRPANTVATYGMTETGSGVVYEGRALDGVELAIADGEILLRSPTLLRCYRDGSSPVNADGWLHTGDAGTLDPDGILSVTGRIAEVIVTGGEKVWPALVERRLSAEPWVARCAVVGRPDPEWGQRVTAVVQPTPGAAVPALDEIRDQLAADLPRYALPRAIELVDGFAGTGSGKIRRDLL